MKIRQKPEETVWQDFKQEVALTDRQLQMFRRYEELLTARNKEFNLTAIKDLSGIVRQHFQDSLAVTPAVDLSAVGTLCDIGSGAGFPGLPLKIMYPQLKIILIEVTKKKQLFLQEVIDALGLEDVQICDLDWRTFMRTTEFKVDLFVTRAAIDPLELCKVYRPASYYRATPMVYWAAEQWEAHKKVVPLIRREVAYRLGHKNRRLIFFGLPEGGASVASNK